MTFLGDLLARFDGELKLDWLSMRIREVLGCDSSMVREKDWCDGTRLLVLKCGALKEEMLEFLSEDLLFRKRSMAV